MKGMGGGGSHAETINNQMESGYIEFDQGKGDKGGGGAHCLHPWPNWFKHPPSLGPKCYSRQAKCR